MTLKAMDVYMSNNFCCSDPLLEKTPSGNTLTAIMENEGSGENTDELLSAEVDEGVDVYGIIPLGLSHDRCDVLLDAIDTQLSHLQIQSRTHGGNSKRYEFPFSGYLDRSHSVSKDTGLGSTVPTTDKTPSNLDETQSDDQTEHQTMEIIKAGVAATDVWRPEESGSLSSVSRVEQCCWRLEKLLGRNAEVAGMGNEEDDLTMDSICTEDFSTRFREEMLVLPASGVPMQSFDLVTIDTDLDTVCSEQSTKRDRDKSSIDRDQLKELSMSLTELQQQKTATLHTLEKLREEVDQAKREHLSLQLSVRDSRVQAQNITCELHRLQAQRDLCLKEVRVLQEQKCVSHSVSVLEREEMDRLLDNTKSELFSEQRRFRHTLDSMQERLDEVNQELEQREEDCRTLRQKCTELEEQLTDTTREKEQIKESLQKDLEQQVKCFSVMERIVAQKELLLQGIEEKKEALLQELCSLREEHTFKLKEIQKKTEQEFEQMTLQLAKSHKEELQKVHQQADESRSAALSEQDQTHKQSLDSLHSCIQLKDKEIKRLKETLAQHEETMRRQAEEFKRETFEKIRKAVKREEKKWEEQRDKALKEQRGTLEQQIVEAVKRGKIEVEKERRNTLALQSKVTELQKEAEKEVVRLKQTLQRSEKELQELRTVLSEKDQKHQRRTARLEQQNKRWAQDIHSECVCLRELLKHNGQTVESKNPSDSPTVSETLETLQSLTKALQQHINDLKHELSSQRRATLQLSREKEHIEEMSSISRAKLRMNDDTDKPSVHLHRQLQAKDDELRQVHSNMAQCKDKNTARLELELNAELERRVPKPRAELQKRLERLENEMRHLTGQCQDHNQSQPASTASQGGTDFQNSRVSQDLSSYKLLRHLQSRIRQLRAESQTRCPSPVKWDRDPTDLGGSYLDTVHQPVSDY
ncbi:golgin subfamily B member 1-like protein [Labeo rohita]|uniref:Golgin subfamily B member 1-like protein n=1 Tax=Labeo rohita TaxID=84645 RepID=A0A498N027_LABRO|nr:golgin subfamily B member 1-like protein [Labeo rohita]